MEMYGGNGNGCGGCDADDGDESIVGVYGCTLECSCRSTALGPHRSTPACTAGDIALRGGVCAATLGAVTVLQYILDRKEKYAVLQQEAAWRNGDAGGKAAGLTQPNLKRCV